MRLSATVISAFLIALPLGCVTEDNQVQTGELSEAISWLEDEAHRLIRASRREMNDGTFAFPPQVGIHYEAFWLRDYAYTLEGSIDSYSDKELIDASRLFVRSLAQDGSGVDCVGFDGTPIYKPGMGTMGENPVADGGQFTVDVAWHTYNRTGDTKFLGEIIESLVATMEAVPRDQESGLVFINPDKDFDRSPYGFTDTIGKTGEVLFSSLLFVQASRQLSDMLKDDNRESESQRWSDEAQLVSENIRSTFWDSEVGLFRAATVACREHDIWGSAFAVYLGVADEDKAQEIAQYFKNHYGQIVQNGQIRHLPGNVYWEKGRERDEYQNGAFWATPAGWFVYTLDLIDPALADQTILDLVSDFQTHGVNEWIFGETRTLPDYLASAALPLDGIRAMLNRRERQTREPQ